MLCVERFASVPCCDAFELTRLGEVSYITDSSIHSMLISTLSLHLTAAIAAGLESWGTTDTTSDGRSAPICRRTHLHATHTWLVPIVRLRCSSQHGKPQLSLLVGKTDASPQPMYGDESVSAPKPQFDMGE